MSFHGEKMEFVCERHAVLPAVFKIGLGFGFFFGWGRGGGLHPMFLPPPHCLLFFGIDPSALQLLKEFSDSCLQLFSLPGYDSNPPQAAHKGSKIHLSLSTHLLVTADGWCWIVRLLLMGFA